MFGSLEKQIAFAFGFALLLLVGLTVLSYRSMTTELAAVNLVSRSQEVIEQLDGLLSHMKDAETGQRGYLITGKDEYLDPYRAAVPGLEQSLIRLRQLLADNPGQQRKLESLEPLIEQRIGALRTGIRLRQEESFAAAMQWTQTDQGKNFMDQVRVSVGEIKDDERRLLRERQSHAVSDATQTLIILPLGSALAFIVTILAYFVIRRQLAHRRVAEEQTLSFTRELERSNRELQDFAFVASHDLQEPLRKIQAFGDRLKTKYEPALSTEGLDYLERMQNAARRMHVLINDLLTFSRVTTKGRPFKPVDMNGVVQDVLGDLEERINQSGGRVEIGNLPTIDADALQMGQLMQNLIGNGLKFRRPEVPPLVRIDSYPVSDPSGNGAQMPDDWCQLTITDNGIGFDEKYLDRIFTPFQRLHARHEYEGTGMGLAVCRRIVERHGGEITARSEPGKGTTFLVTLPIRQQGETATT